MRILICVLAAFPSAAFAPIRPYVPPDRPAIVTVTFASQGSASFHLADGVVTRLTLRARGVDYSVSFECAGGLRDVRYESLELMGFDPDTDPTSAFALLFDMGREEERSYGRLPRVQLSFQGGRVTAMLVTHATSESSSAGGNLCATLPPDPICAPGAPRPRTQDAAALVEQLRALPTPMGRDTADEKLRRSIYQQLLYLDAEAVAPLAQGLRDREVGMRRNAALAFGALGSGWWPFECGQRKVDISAALPALVGALADSNPSVRGWSAQAIGGIGADAASAVPALVALLDDDWEGSRNSACIALRGIGPAASAALPALRRALRDPSSDVRRFAAAAIESIERRP